MATSCFFGAAATSGGGQQTYRFAVIPKALDIPVFNYAKIGAERTAKELGNVTIEWRAPESADQLIDCANHFIRAKREFDERWRTGTL